MKKTDAIKAARRSAITIRNQVYNETVSPVIILSYEECLETILSLFYSGKHLSHILGFSSYRKLSRTATVRGENFPPKKLSDVGLTGKVHQSNASGAAVKRFQQFFAVDRSTL